MRGARVKNIVRELNNEKVDILEWTEDPVTFVREALSPVEPREITVDEEARKIFVTSRTTKTSPRPSAAGARMPASPPA